MDKFLEYQLFGITVEQAIRALILTAVCFLVVKTFYHLFQKVLNKSKVEKGLHTFLKSLVKILLYGLAVMIIAQSLGINMTSVVALFSVVTLAISLALQGVFGNIASGIMLLTIKPFRAGDYIEVDTIKGTVVDISLIYSRIRTLNNQLIYVPNSEVVAGKIKNYSALGLLRVDHTFTASYDAPPEKVKAVLAQVVASVPGALQDPKPRISVQEYGNSSIAYACWVWCKSEDYWNVYFDLIEGVKPAFDAAGIEITYDHLNVHIQGLPEQKDNM